MAVFRLSLLLHVGFVIGSSRFDADRSAVGEVEANLGARLAHLRAPRLVPGEKPEEHLPRVVTAFLHTGDSTTLRHANCSRKYELTSLLRGRSHETPHYSMSGVLETVLHATNFLNMILQANRSREHNLRRDMEWYHALVRSILEADAKIHRAVVTFGGDASFAGPPVLLQATRAGGEIVLQDLPRMARRHLHNRTADTEWYHGMREKQEPRFHKRVLSKGGDGSPERAESFIPDRTHVKWSAPYLECENGNFVPRWLLTLSAAFYGLKSNLDPEFGVVRVDVNLQDVDIDQCSTDGWFAGTHRCNLTTMEPSDCLPCQQGCAFCKDNSPCVVLEDGALRLAVLSFQCLCMLIVFISMVLIYHFRRNKVGILYFHPSVFRCILLRWVRLLGFATVYGTLTLKLYRVLKVFLSRTAQRIPYMTSWRVLRLLAIILLIVCWFLVAWTSAVCQNPDRKLALIDVGHTPDGSQFGMCLLDRWDYMMAVEFLFLLWAVYLCYAVRTVPSAFHEPRYMAIAVHNELVLSAIFHVIFTLGHELHPDWILLLFFTHTHLTVTVTLGLLLVPKFLFAGTHMRDDIASEAYEDELDMGRSGSYLNSSITSAWSEHSLDPEDIRTPEEMGHLSSINGCGVRSCDSLWEKRTNEELKKLYSQLEIYKRKKMLANNPHLQKKRSSKKGLGRSLMRRITEIPESVHRQCSREDKEVGDYGSNRNSICMLKKNPLDPSHQVKPAKEETLKNKVFSLKKSHSSYDHVRDQNEEANRATTDKMETATNEGSLLDTLMGKKLVKKKSSENISAPSESTESVPLVCKSASAHNLTADKKPIHPRASMLQKSLSVIASAKEKTLGLTGKTQSSEDSNKKSQPKNKDTKVNAEAENDCQPKMIISQSVDYKQSAAKGRIMKQPVTGSQPAICSDPVWGKDLYDVSEVCPWELEDLPTPSENKIQKHVSIAPTESTTIHGGSTKGSKSQKQKASDQSPSGGKHSKESQRTTSVRAEVCPWEEGGETQACLSEGPRQQVSSQSRSNRPHSTLESSKTKRADICPWDFEEQQKVTELARSPDTMKQKKSSSPVDGRGRNPISDAPKGVTSLPLPTTKAEICPWDYDSAVVSPSTDRTPSPAQAPKAKESPTLRKGAPSTRTVEKEKSKDTEDEKSLTKSSDKRLSQQKLSEVCPWDVESPQEEKRKSANVGAAKPKQAEVCPWDFEDVSSKTGSDKNAPVEKQSNPNLKAVAASSAKKAEVCPWDFDESKSSKKA
uniref:G-protein coupled receptors family 3 profile domain-containing protein n=1 Tax=Poecilia mexicana TaxID=48701 RepID=A0A3B3X4D4_9TELE